MYLPFQFGTFFIDHFRHTFGGIYRRSGFNDKQVTLLQIRDHGTGGRFHIGDVRPMVLLERGRHYDKESIRRFRLAYSTQLSTLHYVPDYLTQFRFYNMYLSLVDRFHHRRIDIYSYDFETVSGSNGCRRKADIP